MKKLIFIILLLTGAVVANAVPDEIKWRLSGIVKSDDGRPLPGASIIVEGTYLGTSAGRDGTFSFPHVSGGEYSLIVSYIGYADDTVRVKVDRDVYIEITLGIGIIESEEIIVRGIRATSDTPVASSDIDRDQIRKINTAQDIPFLLSLVPSVIETSEAGAGIGYTALRIRGSDASRINITLDGIPLNDSESQQVFWVNMPDLASSVSGIQVQRGVGTSTNGAGAFGGSINMTLQNPSDKAYTELSTSFGSFGTLKATASLGTGYLKDKLKFDMRFSGITSEGYIDRAGSDHRSFIVSGLYRMKSSILKANFIHGEEVTGISWWGVPQDSLATNRTYNPAGEYYDNFGNLRYYKGQTDNYAQTHFHLVYNWQLNDNIFIKTAGHFTRGAGYYEQFKEDEKLSDYDLPNWILHGLFEDVILDETDLIRRKWMYNYYYGGVFNFNYTGAKLDLSVGGAVNSYVGDHYGRVIWMRYAGNSEMDYQWYLNGGRKDEFNLYSKANYRLTDIITLYGDLQYRNIDYEISGTDDDLRYLDIDDNFNFLNPKAGVFARISPHFSTFFSLAIANREPTRANYKDAAGDDSVKPSAETLYDYEGGLEWRYSKLSASANMYYMYYYDQLVPTGKLSNVGYPIMTNVDRSYRAGIELQAAYRPSSLLEGSASLTLSRNRIKNFTEYATNYNTSDWSDEEVSFDLGDVDIAYSPSVTASGVISFYPFRDAGVHFIGKYVGKQYFDNTMSENRAISPYLVNNLRLDYSFDLKNVTRVSLQFLVNNIFNSRYESNAYGGNWYEDMQEYTWAYYFPQAGINYLVKIGFKF